ncbi:MAG: hypothetical protein ACI87N_002018, partial [Flavobacteriales bacterium]
SISRISIFFLQKISPISPSLPHLQSVSNLGTQTAIHSIPEAQLPVGDFVLFMTFNT